MVVVLKFVRVEIDFFGQETYDGDPQVLQDAMGFLAEDFASILRHGLQLRNGDTIRLAVLGVKGDWPYLISAGNLCRHFRHAPKKGESACAMHGICHFCCAGMANYPFSDCGASPRFMKSVGSAAAALWHSSPSPFTCILPNNQRCPEQLYRPDIWHNYHLGLGRYFVSSSLIVMLPMWPGSSVPHKLEAMTISWKAYCRMKRKKPILQKFTRELLGFQGPLDWPEGNWQKAATTTLLHEPCQFLGRGFETFFFLGFWFPHHFKHEVPNSAEPSGMAGA